jgi:hypothetical protein
LHLTFGKAAVEIKERAVFGAATVAVAIGLAAFEKALDQLSVQEVGRELKRAQEMGFALTQRQGGSSLERRHLTHSYW